MTNIEDILGKVFVSENNDWYGCIRKIEGKLPDDLRKNKVMPFAEDEFGNYFVIKDNEVLFWDHETNSLTKLARSYEEFKVGCVNEPEVELDESQVESVWIDPEFAKENGIEVPESGWKKKP